MALWGGRFTKETDALANRFHSSIGFDRRLYRQDIAGSMAHAAMLAKQGIISADDGQAIAGGLEGILADIESGAVTFDDDAEDIHMFIEALLTERIGEAGKRLHTGRSRNDQVATDFKLWTREQAEALRGLLRSLISALVDIAEGHTGAVMPGYTHLQPAQPVTLAHHLLAYAEMFRRDESRLADARARMDECPLGSGALAGTTYPIDREMTAAALGFGHVTRNSLDGVADRDFALEFVSCAAIIMAHMSRLCEELVRWSSPAFGFVEIDDAYATGSSMMPQKKNPDMAELIRGKTGRVYGGLISLLTMMKGLPLAYNTDMQEDKEQAFDAADAVSACLAVLADMLRTAAFKPANMRAAANRGFINATDAADYLVTKGAAFRDAHEAAGKLVLYCIDNDKTLEGLTMDEYRRFSPLFDEGVYAAVDIAACVNRRDLIGGPAEPRVKAEIARHREWLGAVRDGASV